MKKLVLVALTLLASGCAQTLTHYQPTVDTYGDRRSSYISQDLYECQELATHAGNMTSNTLANGGTGAVLGAAAGAIGGTFLGNPAIGAAVGAAAGGLGGGTSGALSADATYKRTFKNCMRNRGHQVVD